MQWTTLPSTNALEFLKTSRIVELSLAKSSFYEHIIVERSKQDDSDSPFEIPSDDEPLMEVQAGEEKSCKELHTWNADRIFRHNSLRDGVFSAAQTATLAPRKEVPSLASSQAPRIALPMSSYIPCWKGGRPAALDITVISTMQQLTIRSAAEIQGHALLVAEERKFAAHGAECQAACISFIPLAIETLGGLSDTTADTISNIGRLIGQRFGISPRESSCQLFQRLAISLWRGNASAWIHRCLPRAPFLV